MMTQELFFTSLKKRGVIKISGEDRRKFLQGLISNDIDLLDTQSCVYACLLTPNGKFLYDFFITETDETLFVECEGGERATKLGKLLNIYKLRADIHISVEEYIPVYAILNNKKLGTPDPRAPEMGYRSFEKPEGLTEAPFDTWDRQRLSLGIPDGSRDMVPEKSTLLECNIDKFNGVSFEKGCYMGQELTARMHYRGLAKKHLYTVTPERLGRAALPAPFTPLEKDGHVIGEMRSSCGDVGLALVKDGVIEDA